MNDIVTGDIVRESARLIDRTKPISAAYVIVTALASMVSDLPEWERAGMLASTAVSLALGYALVVTMTERGGLTEHNRARFWPYLALAILSTLGIGLGALLLIVPGLFLWVRWTAAYAFLAAEGSGVIESLAQSFEVTRGNFWPILGALVIPLGLILASIVVLVIWSSDDGQIELGVSAFLNFAISIAGLLTTAIGLAIYSLRVRSPGAFDEVFA
jgi:hypothetical protein